MKFQPFKINLWSNIYAVDNFVKINAWSMKELGQHNAFALRSLPRQLQA